MSFSLRIHEGERGRVVAACDTALLGKQFTDDDVTLTVSESFYDGETATLDEIIAAVDRAMTANFVGETLVNALIEENVVEQDEVHHVDGVPHVQMFFI